jgi:MFS family permease
MLALAQNVGTLYLGRFFAGIATGASCVVAPMFISEIAETSLRGALGAFFQLFLTVGILFDYLVGAIVDWRTFTWSCAIFPILLIVTVFFIPDSPIFLVKQVMIYLLITQLY